MAIEDDLGAFTSKSPPKVKPASAQAQRRITQAEIEKRARPGESYAQAAERLRGLKERR